VREEQVIPGSSSENGRRESVDEQLRYQLIEGEIFLHTRKRRS
jgi:hypothetical protein